MKLVRFRIRNFRCYSSEVSIDFDDITGIVGRNDAGKSSITDALNIFFDADKIDKEDACKSGDSKDVRLICEFGDLPDTIVIDSNFHTTLAGEYLLNESGNLELHKVYDCSLATPKLRDVFAVALHPTAEHYADLLELKRTELIKRASDLSIDISGVPKTANAPIRQAIWASAGDLDIKTARIPLNLEDAKKIWDQLSSRLPLFALFRSDRESSDQDPEAQDPLRTAVKEALASRSAELDSIVEHVVSQVQLIANRTVEKIREMDPSLATQLVPRIAPPKWDSLFKTSITGDENIPLNKRGSGVRRLILLNFFRAKAEADLHQRQSPGIIYAIEEPETSQHPNNQRVLLSALNDLAQNPSCQVIFTTHTPVLARTIPDNKIRFVTTDTQGKRIVTSGGDQSTNDAVAKSLGILPDHNVRIFVGVEGKHDIAALKIFSKILANSGENVPDLEHMEQAGELIFFPLGGSNLAMWTSRLSHLNRPEFHLFDRDTQPPLPAKYESEAAAINARPHCSATITAKREIENYIHFQAINAAYSQSGVQLGFLAPFADFDDVPSFVAARVHTLGNSPVTWQSLPDDKKNKKVSKAKYMLNNVALGSMTRDQLDQVDTAGEVLSWFGAISQLMT